MDLENIDFFDIDWQQVWATCRESFDTLSARFKGLGGSEEGLIALLTAGAVLSLLALFAIIRLFRRTARDRSLARETRATRMAGYAVALIFFGVFGAWSAVATLSGAAVAMGVVSPDGSRKTVQHLEGGLVQTIHVREGDSVAAGAPLLTLQNTRALARYDELHERQLFLLAVEARLVAEQSGATEIVFPGVLLNDQDAAAQAALESQMALFSDSMEVQEAREKILKQRIAQLNEEIAGLREVISAQDEQLALLGQELEGARQLFERGLAQLPRVLALERLQAEIRGARATNRAAIARNEQQIGETELQLLATLQQRREEASAQLAEVRAELTTITSQLPERIDTLARTTVYAPTDGRVMNVRVTTENGGVLAPGDPILDIVPDEADLIIDARVRPQDVDTVYPGLRARVLLTAFNQRYMPRLFGEVTSLSADRLVDERTGEPYFLAKVRVDLNEIDALGADIELVAGMPAEVMILTGERTLLDLMVQPIADSIRRSFRDHS